MMKFVRAALTVAIYFALAAQGQVQAQAPQPFGIVGGIGAGSYSPKEFSVSSAKNLCTLGTSITAQADSQTGIDYIAAIDGNYPTWTSLFTNYTPLRLPAGLVPPGNGNYGKNGDLLAQIATRVDTAISFGCDFILIEGGANDSTTPCATSVATLRAMYAKLIASPTVKGFIRLTIYPRDAGNAYTSTQAKELNCVNEADRQFFSQQKITQSGGFLADIEPLVTDPSQTPNWRPIAGYLTDNVHPSPTGGAVIGFEVARIINSLVPAQFRPAASVSNVYDATHNPYGNTLPNPLMTGTGGTLTGSNCTGTTVSNSTLDGTNKGSTATCVGSSVTLSNNVIGQKIVYSDASCAASEQVDWSQTVSSPGTVFSAGDVVQGEVYVNVGPNTGLAGFQVVLVTVDDNGTTDMWGIKVNPAITFPATGFSGRILTGRYTMAGTVTGAALHIIPVSMTTCGGGALSATVVISSPKVFKVQP